MTHLQFRSGAYQPPVTDGAGPTIAQISDGPDNTPEFSIALTSPAVADIVTLRRSSTTSFVSYTDFTDTVDVVDPVNALDFNTGTWSDGTYYCYAFVTRASVAGDHGNVLTVVIDTTIPVLTGALDAANGGTAGTCSVTTDKGNGTLYWVVSTSSTAPTRTQVKQGKSASGAAATASGSQAVSGTGSQSITGVTGLTSETTYYLHCMHENNTGGQSNVASGDGFTTADITAPTLSSPTDISVSSTQSSGTVSTNEANGTLYGVVSTSATPPTATQVKAGQMHTGAAAAANTSAAISSTGTKTLTFSGLTDATAYFTHYMHEDAAGNKSSVSSADGFTTSAWTPASLGSNLKAWYKADAGVTLNVSDVSAWADQSGGGADLAQATGTKQPAYSATGFNSHSGITFTSGNGDGLVSSLNDLTIGATATLSVYVVMQMLSGTTAYGRLVSYIASGQTLDYSNSASFCIIRDASTNAIAVSNSGGALKASQAVSLSTNYRIGFIMNGSTITPYLNNVAGTPTAMSSTLGATGTIGIGCVADNSGVSWSGPVAEVVITDVALDSTQRTQIDDYFKAKWGL